MKTSIALVATATTFLPLASTPTTWGQCEQARLRSGVPDFEDRFGHSVAADGDVVVVGEFQDNLGEHNHAGSAWVFRRHGAVWDHEGHRLPSSPKGGGHFGQAVAVSGDVVAVGEPGVPQGAAHAFRYDEATGEWRWERLLPDPAPEGAFGSALAVWGDWIVVGAPQFGPGSTGAAYVFEYVDPLWQQVQILGPEDLDHAAAFGRSGIDSCHDVLVVGAHGADGERDGTGAAYVFRLDGESRRWQLEQKLCAHDGESGDWFGRSVGCRDDLVVVGAPHDDDLGDQSGSAYVYRYRPSDGTWRYEQKLTASDGTLLDRFGSAVAVETDLIAVGAPGDDIEHGAAYLYRHDGVRWEERRPLRASDRSRDDLFGVSVSMTDGTAVVGAPGHDRGAGAAYIFDVDACLCPEDLDGNGAIDFGDILWILTAWGNAGGSEDLDGSGFVDFGDILTVLSAWGPCA